MRCLICGGKAENSIILIVEIQKDVKNAIRMQCEE